MVFLVILWCPVICPVFILLTVMVFLIILWCPVICPVFFLFYCMKNNLLKLRAALQLGCVPGRRLTPAIPAGLAWLAYEVGAGGLGGFLLCWEPELVSLYSGADCLYVQQVLIPGHSLPLLFPCLFLLLHIDVYPHDGDVSPGDS